MIYLIYPNLVMTYSKYPKTYFIYYPLKSLGAAMAFPRSPKDFQELLLGSAVYVGVGPGSWVIATSIENNQYMTYDIIMTTQKKDRKKQTKQ